MTYKIMRCNHIFFNTKTFDYLKNYQFNVFLCYNTQIFIFYF